MKTFETTVLGVGPFCMEYADGEIIAFRTRDRRDRVAAAESVHESDALSSLPVPTTPEAWAKWMTFCNQNPHARFPAATVAFLLGTLAALQFDPPAATVTEGAINHLAARLEALLNEEYPDGLPVHYQQFFESIRTRKQYE